MAWELNRLLPAQPAAQESRDEGGDTQWKANKQFVLKNQEGPARPNKMNTSRQAPKQKESGCTPDLR